MRDLLKTVRTALHLSPGQATAWAVRRWLPSRPPRLVVDPRRAVPSSRWSELARESRRLESVNAVADGYPAVLEEAERLVARRYRFLGEEMSLPEIDWMAEYESPLWTFHLHYLDHAVTLAMAWAQTGSSRFGERLVEVWSDWLDAAEEGRARMVSYPVSVRSMNGFRCLWLVEDRMPEGFAERLRAGVHAQLDWLAHHVERHLRANHLQKNLTALSWGALAFEDGGRWNGHLAELWQELEEQVLADGGHFERSPMYHALALDDYLRTLALCRQAAVPLPACVEGRLTQMTHAFQCLSRPDGTLHLFNDAANGERPPRSEVLSRATYVLGAAFDEPESAFALPATGYFGYISAESGTRLVIDAGPPGPRYQPGHAHCDMLSFELDLAGRPVVVDSGLHGYEGSPFREYVRSTRAHNTVLVDDEEQHEFWATFRLARRGDIVGEPLLEELVNGIAFRGSCRPYHDAGIVHRRVLRLEGNALSVTDHVDGAIGRSVSSFLHLHPDFQLLPIENGYLANASIRVRIEPFGGEETLIHVGEAGPRQGWYCPSFGRALEAPVLELRIGSCTGQPFGWRVVLS